MDKNYSGVLYFYVHFVTEIACFYCLSLVVGDSWILWLVPFVYDILAFVPQLFIGAISDRFEKIPFGAIGAVMMMVALGLFMIPGLSALVSVMIIALGNACVHVNGAEVTLRSGAGKMSPVAIFVAGGSFGVVSGKILAEVAPVWQIILLVATIIPIIAVAEQYRKATAGMKQPCRNYQFANLKNPIWLVTVAVMFVVMTRSFVGYCIPTAWNKTMMQTVALFAFMGVGKALGGVLIDKIGIRKTIYTSMLGAIPFLLFGNGLMMVSLIGVVFFSMTMAITLAILVSICRDNPGVAFGFTTVGLAIGAMPIFFFKITDLLVNDIIIVIMSIMCLCILLKVTKKEV